MLLINKGDFVLQSDRRVVKAADVATVRSAADIIAAAEAQAAQIREDAKAAYEEERKKGYDKGIADGKTEIAMQKLDLVDSSVAFMENVEEKMSEIVMKALKTGHPQGRARARGDCPCARFRAHSDFSHD